MKRTVILLLAALPFWAGCEKSEVKNPGIETPDAEVVFLYHETSAKSASVILKDVDDYTVKTEYPGVHKNWLKVDKKPGRIELTPLSPNGEKEERVATLKISAEGAETKEIKVRHAFANEAVVRLSKPALDFAWDAINVDQYVKVTVDAPDYNVTIAYTGDEKDWLSFTKDGSALLIHAVSKNTGAAQREAEVRVNVGDQAPQVIKVHQENYVDANESVALSPARLVFLRDAVNETQVATAQTSFQPVKAALATPGADAWLKVGVDGKSISATVLSVNPSHTESRVAVVEVTNDKGAKAMLVVEQNSQTAVSLEGEWEFTAESSANGLPEDVANPDVNGFASKTAISGKVNIVKTSYGYAIRGVKGVGTWKPAGSGFRNPAVPFWNDKTDIVPEIPLRLLGAGRYAAGDYSLKFGDFWFARGAIAGPPALVATVAPSADPKGGAANILFSPAFNYQYTADVPVTQNESQFAFGANLSYYAEAGDAKERVEDPLYFYTDPNMEVAYTTDATGDKLVFPTTYSNPNVKDGKTAHVVFMYYHVKTFSVKAEGYPPVQTARIGYESVDYLRNIVLTRAAKPAGK